VPLTEKQPEVRLIPLAKVDVDAPVTERSAVERPPANVEVADDDAIKNDASMSEFEEIPPAKVDVAVDVAVMYGTNPGLTVQFALPGVHDGSRVSPGEYADDGGAAWAKNGITTIARVAIDTKKETHFVVLSRFTTLIILCPIFFDRQLNCGELFDI